MRDFLLTSPQLIKIYAAYKPWVSSKGIFIDISIMIGCNFPGINTVVSSVLQTPSQKDFYYSIFTSSPCGLDLGRFYSKDAFLADENFGIEPPADLLKIERASCFLPMDAYAAQERNADDFSSSDDDEIVFQSKNSSRIQSTKAELEKEPMLENNRPNNTPDKADNTNFVNPNDTPIKNQRKRRRRNL